MKYIANMITASRIVFAVGMVLAAPFSILFWVFFFSAGLSDMVDGYVARKLKCESALGATLDSVADLAFAIAILFVVLKNISIPMWLWLCSAIIGLLRITGYGIGFYKYHTFSSLHTWLNKATGALIFAFPLLYALFGLPVAGAGISFVALLSAIEELAITVKSRELEKDCKGFFAQKWS